MRTARNGGIIFPIKIKVNWIFAIDQNGRQQMMFSFNSRVEESIHIENVNSPLTGSRHSKMQMSRSCFYLRRYDERPRGQQQSVLNRNVFASVLSGFLCFILTNLRRNKMDLVLRDGWHAGSVKHRKSREKQISEDFF